jgi:hypothetical protein
LNNWRAVGYIFLGWGSVFLTLGLLAFFGIVSIFSTVPILSQASILVSLAASAPWFVLAALLYVVGVVGYYAGRENVAPSDEENVEEMQEDASQPISNRIDPQWAFPMGVLTVLAVLAFQIVLGIMNTSNVIYGVVLPTFYSIIAGSIVGIVAYLIIPHIN